MIDAGLLAPVRAGIAAASATDDAAWLRAMLDAEAALVRAQATLGAAPPSAAETITKIAETGEFDIESLARRARGAANPIVAIVGALGEAVAAVDPVAAEYVHRGSTSQDIMDTAAMLIVARSGALIQADLDRVEAATLGLAENHRDTLMPGRTLGAHAVPVTFGLKAAGWATAVHDVSARLHALLVGLPVQLGGAAGTLAGYLANTPEDLDPGAYTQALTAEFARETGLTASPLPWHTNRIPIADTGFTLAMVTGVLGKLAVDVQTLSRTEIGEVSEPAAEGRGVSSAMPHKRNPALATLIRAAATQTPALAATLAACLPAEDERSAGAWHAEWQPLRELLRLTAGAAETAAELVEGLVVHAERMRANLDMTHGLIVSERLSATLVPLLGRVQAATTTRAASVTAHATATPLRDVLAADPAVTAHLSPDDLTALTAPEGYLGAAQALVDATVTMRDQGEPTRSDRPAQ